MVRDLQNVLKAYKLGVPTIFDIAVCLFILILPVSQYINPTYTWRMMQSIFLVWGTIVLMCTSFCMPQYRSLRVTPLGLLTLVSLVNVFVHSWKIHEGSVTCDFINWYLMNEGFLYIFFGVCLVHTIVCYGKEYGWYILCVLGVLAGYFSWCVKTWSMSPLMGLFLAGGITLWKARERALAALLLVVGATFAAYKWSWLYMKWRCRPDVWWYSIQEIIKSGGWGKGFDHSLASIKGYIQAGHGWLQMYRHNDYLELGRSLGVIAVVLIAWFLIDLFRKSKPSVIYTLALAASIQSLFQTSMRFPVHAGIVLILVSIVCVENQAGG